MVYFGRALSQYFLQLTLKQSYLKKYKDKFMWEN